MYNQHTNMVSEEQTEKFKRTIVRMREVGNLSWGQIASRAKLDKFISGNGSSAQLLQDIYNSSRPSEEVYNAIMRASKGIRSPHISDSKLKEKIKETIKNNPESTKKDIIKNFTVNERRVTYAIKDMLKEGIVRNVSTDKRMIKLILVEKEKVNVPISFVKEIKDGDKNNLSLEDELKHLIEETKPENKYKKEFEETKSIDLSSIPERKEKKVEFLNIDINEPSFITLARTHLEDTITCLQESYNEINDDAPKYLKEIYKNLIKEWSEDAMNLLVKMEK